MFFVASPVVSLTCTFGFYGSKRLSLYIYKVKKEKVNINFPKMAETYRKYVRKKAILAGSSIVYVRGNKLIKENPGTLVKTILIENITRG